MTRKLNQTIKGNEEIKKESDRLDHEKSEIILNLQYISFGNICN